MVKTRKIGRSCRSPLRNVKPCSTYLTRLRFTNLHLSGKACIGSYQRVKIGG